MAETNDTTPSSPAEAGASSMEIEFGGAGQEDGVVRTTPRGSVSTDEGAPNDSGSDGESGDAGQDTQPDGEAGQEAAGDGGDEAPDVGEFRADDPDVVALYDATYKTPDGALNMEALSGEWWSSAVQSEDGVFVGTLKDGTYAYLESLGIPKDVVKDYEKAMVAQAAHVRAEIVAKSGGKDTVEAALKWGREGGYTPAQRERFNAAMRSSDLETVSDALDALVARYERSNPRADGAKKTPPPVPRREVRTDRASASDGYGSREEWAKDFREANAKSRQSERDAALAEVRRRFLATRGRENWED